MSASRSVPVWLRTGLLGVMVGGVLGCSPSVSPRIPSSEKTSQQVEKSVTGDPADPLAEGTSPTIEAKAPSTVVSKSAKLRDITFDDLKFDIEKGAPFERSMLTPKIEELNQSRVKIRGYILPSFQQSGITEFVLVRDNMECCFGPGAAIYDCILIKMSPDKTTDYTIRPVAVEGTLRIEEFLDLEGKPLAVYQMVGDKVE